MEKIILEQTLHTKDDRKDLLNFLISKAKTAAAVERVSLATAAESICAEVVATRKKSFDDLLNHGAVMEKHRVL